MSIDGAWNLTMNGPMGAQTATLTVKSNGDDLDGELAGPQGTVAMQDGKLDGDSATWSVTVEQMAMKIDFSVSIDGDKMTGEALGTFGKATVEGARA